MKFTYAQLLPKQKRQDKLTPLERRFEKWPKRFQWLSDHWEHILSALAAILIGISSIISSPSVTAWILLTAGGVLLGFSVVSASKRRKLLTQIEEYYLGLDKERLNELSKRAKQITQLTEAIKNAEQGTDADRQAVRDVLHEATASLAQELNLWDTKTRLSLYRHNASTREFIRIARVSDNPGLEAVGRTQYPDNEGIISEAWRQGHAFAPDMPETLGRWKQQQVSQFGLAKETAEALTMHAIWMLGVRIDYKGEKLGLIVVEGEEKGRLTAEDADVVQSSNLFKTTLPRLLFASQIVLRRYWGQERLVTELAEQEPVTTQNETNPK